MIDREAGSFSEGAPPPAVLRRLCSLPPPEFELYQRLFRAAGGSPDTPVSGAAVAELLQHTKLSQDLLRRIWDFADDAGSGFLDLEGFCVACRLCGHAQQASDPEGAEVVVEVADMLVTEIPAALPNFEGWVAEPGPAARTTALNPDAGDFQPSPLGGSQPPRRQRGDGGGQQAARRRRGGGSGGSTAASQPKVMPGFYDFEAAAFGTDDGHQRGAVPPAGDPGIGIAPHLPGPGTDRLRAAPPPADVTTGGAWSPGGGGVASSSSFAEVSVLPRHRPADGTGGGKGSDNFTTFRDPVDEPAARSSAAVLGEALATGERRGGRDRRRSSTDRLADEMVEGRQHLDGCIARQRRTERGIATARARLQANLDQRHLVVAELARRRSDVDHLFSELNFAREQIEGLERELVRLRCAREVFGQRDLWRAEQTQGRLAMEGVPREDRNGVLTSARFALDILIKDRREIAGLGDKAKLVGRKKLDLQAKQQLVLETNRGVSSARATLMHAVEVERTRLHYMRSDRLQLGEDRHILIKEVHRICCETGLEPPTVLRLCFPERSSGSSFSSFHHGEAKSQPHRHRPPPPVSEYFLGDRGGSGGAAVAAAERHAAPSWSAAMYGGQAAAAAANAQGGGAGGGRGAGGGGWGGWGRQGCAVSGGRGSMASAPTLAVPVQAGLARWPEFGAGAGPGASGRGAAWRHRQPSHSLPVVSAT